LGAIARCKLGQGLGDGGPQILEGARCRLLQERLELGECHLDWVEIGRVWRQVAQCCAYGLDRSAHGVRLVGGQIVHHDDVAGPEGGSQHLLDPRQERRPVHGTIEHCRRGHASKPEAADECRRLPMTVRDRSQTAGAAQGPPAQPGHLGRRAGLIDEDEALRIELCLCGAPGLSLRGDVGSVLLAGVRGFF